ncbi:MAG: type II toxin-antitoxin system VapC family toxin [Carbonactinosporaceae bacterium]
MNVLVYAHREESPRHHDYLGWLDEARAGAEPLGVADLVLGGFLRVVTHPRVFRRPTSLGTAIDFVTTVRASPAVVALTPGPRHWSVFVDLCREARVTGNLVPDALLAALAVEHGATLCTADRGFGRFPRLRWEDPIGH